MGFPGLDAEDDGLNDKERAARLGAKFDAARAADAKVLLLTDPNRELLSGGEAWLRPEFAAALHATPVPVDRNDLEAILRRWPQLLKYDPRTGLIYRRQAVETLALSASYQWADATNRALLLKNAQVTFQAGSTFNRSSQVIVDGLRAPAADVVWLLHHGRWPTCKLGRKDGDNLNDRLENLDEPDEPDETLGADRRPKGVCRFGGGWQAYVYTNGKQKNLGRFATIEEAIEARRAADEGRWAPRPRGRPPGAKGRKIVKPPKTWLNGRPGLFKAWGVYRSSTRTLGEFATIDDALEACARFEREVIVEDLV